VGTFVSDIPDIDDAELEKLSGDSVMRGVKSNNLNTYGASGDIVMALHNLRRG
jgi:hypothetical protein